MIAQSHPQGLACQQSHLIPSTAWLIENDLFRNRDYAKFGQKSLPEWGFDISKRNMVLLEEYRVENQLERLKPTPVDNSLLIKSQKELNREN